MSLDTDATTPAPATPPKNVSGFSRMAGGLAILAALTLPVSYGRNWFLSHQPNGSVLLGAYAQLMILVQIVATFMVYGGASVFNHFVPKLGTAGLRGRFLIGNALFSGACVLITCSLALLLPQAPRIAFGDIHPPQELLLLLCAIPAVAFSTIVTSAVGGLGNFRAVAIYEILFLLVPLVPLAILSRSAAGLEFVASLGWIVVGWLVLSGLALFFKYVYPQCELSVSRVAFPEGYWHFGGAIYLTTAITFFYQYFDQILVSNYLSTAKLGEFFLIAQLAQLVIFVPQKLSQFALHEFSKKTAIADVEKTYHRAAGLSIWTVTTVAAFVIAATPLLSKLFGKTITPEGERGLTLLAAGCSASAFGALNSMLILSRRETRLYIINNAFLIAMQAAINFRLIPTLGINGAVIGRIVAIALGQTGLYLIVRIKIFRTLTIPSSYWFCQAAIWTMALVPGIGLGGRAAISILIATCATMHFLKARKEDHS